MPTIVVRYRPKAGQASANQKLVEAVFTELAQTQPADFSYTTVRLDDQSFLHIAEVAPGDNPLDKLGSFAAFLDGIEDRCEPGEGPAGQPATVVGTYQARSASV